MLYINCLNVRQPNKSTEFAFLLFSSDSILFPQPLAASDYIQIAQFFHTVLIKDVPQLDLNSKSQARRFITLIDTLYDNKVRVSFYCAWIQIVQWLEWALWQVVISSDVPMDKLFSTEKKSEGISDDDRKLMDDLQITPDSVIFPLSPNASNRWSWHEFGSFSTGTCSRERFHRWRRDIRLSTCGFTAERDARQWILATMEQESSIIQLLGSQIRFLRYFVVHKMLSLLVYLINTSTKMM